MSELFDRYLGDHAKRHKKQSSVRNDTRMIEKRLRRTFGQMRVSSVSRQQIRAFHAGMESTPYEANRVLALLLKIFTVAADDLEWIDRGAHPVKGIRRFVEEKRRRYLSNAELARLGEALAKAEAGELGRSFSPYAIAMLRLLIATGARCSEILKLRWDEVNFERRCLELTDSKTGKKEMYLPPFALQILSEIPRQERNPYVIVGGNPGKHLINVKDSWSDLPPETSLVLM